jgi:hypothetical protein
MRPERLAGSAEGKDRMTRPKIAAVRLVVLALLLAVAFAGAYERFPFTFLDW